ncbi:hypothetical protein EDD16DRAFT_1168272 [Pisolithus croceorrhizus]|nr:hypothetical protein EDD16DRAFT_1168272 [Pisolithus croceorrhizus]KAI6114940.1 hypothetical protein EV401DRAFT_2235740 [Pisolithus croceorrhizus]KAI6163809.1 hypothetical protein EDD17DRAFT_437339 [Pisolithus thermaeus]
MSVDQLSTSVSSGPPRSLTSRLSDETAKGHPRTSRDGQPRHANSPSGRLARRKDASARAEDLVDTDPFASLHLPNPSLRRRSSRLSRWLADLPNRSGLSTPSDIDDLSQVEPVGTRCNPYLAYPHLGTMVHGRTCEDDASTHDYVLVDNGEAQSYPADQPVRGKASHEPALSDARGPPTIRHSNATPSPRNFHLSIRPASPSMSSSTTRNPSRLSMFHKSSRPESSSKASQMGQHARSSSAQSSPPHACLQVPENPTWRWRPSVLGHFQSASVPDNRLLSPGDATFDRSRPSMSSSTNTFSSTHTTATKIYDDGDSPVPSSAPSKASSIFGSIRSRTDRSRITSQPPSKSDIRTSSSPSAWSQPRSSLNLPGPPGLSRTIARKASVLRLPFTNKAKPSSHSAATQAVAEEQGSSQPHVLYTSRGGGPRVSLSSISSQSRKKRLVISGIALNDSTRLEAVQRWCESFGEVDQVTRMPNGDLHVNFRKAEVADMVCRVRARVQIAGVGSVHLSWTYGHKRS